MPNFAGASTLIAGTEHTNLWLCISCLWHQRQSWALAHHHSPLCQPTWIQQQVWFEQTTYPLPPNSPHPAFQDQFKKWPWKWRVVFCSHILLASRMTVQTFHSQRVQKLHSPNKLLLIKEVLWKAKFFILCGVIFLVRLQGKFGIDHSWEQKD